MGRVRSGHGHQGLLTSCALRLGKPHQNDTISDALLSPGSATARGPILVLSLSRRAPFGDQLDVPPDQDPSTDALFKGDMNRDPERLHRIETSDFRPSEAFFAFPDVRAVSASYPLRAPRETASCPREVEPLRATRLLRNQPYGLSLGFAGEILLSDSCNQLTDTSTRGPDDS